MPDPDRYAAAQAATLRDDWQFSRVFATEAARAGFTALLALRAEMQQLIAQANEPAIAAMKFEWWRGEIERGFHGEAQHPLARALGHHLARAGAPEYCVEIVDAAETESNADAPLTEQDFRLYLYRSGGVLAEQLALLSGHAQRRELDAARRLGQLRRCMDLLLATGAMLRAGRWLFPAAWLSERGLNAASVLTHSADANVAGLLRQLLDALDRERVAARTAMEDTSLPPSLLLQWSLVQRDHARLRERPTLMLAPQPARGAALSRLWTAWRAARRSRTSSFI